VVITDAYDTSGKELDDLRDEIASHEVQVFSIGLRAIFEGVTDPTAEPLFEMVLRVLSRDTGGLSVIADLPELQSTTAIEGLISFARVVDLQLRGQYTLGYLTTKTGPLASRVLRVRTTQPGLRVQVRRDAEEPLRPKR
jgi:hypothetical protein